MLAQLLGEPARPDMVLRQPVDHLSSATMPAAARMPAWRMPPPSILRIRRARRMNARPPHRTEPTGAHSALGQAEGDRIGRRGAAAAAGTPSATAALKMRAPSRCRRKPWRRATAPRQRVYSTAAAAPPQRLCVFSRQISG